MTEPRKTRAVVYKSQRGDWGFTIVDEDNNSAAIIYRPTACAAIQAGENWFRRPGLSWIERTGDVLAETDHPCVTISKTQTWYEAIIQ
jgi:hypothetical protein